MASSREECRYFIGSDEFPFYMYYHNCNPLKFSSFIWKTLDAIRWCPPVKLERVSCGMLADYIEEHPEEYFGNEDTKLLLCEWLRGLFKGGR